MSHASILWHWWRVDKEFVLGECESCISAPFIIRYVILGD